MEMSDQPHVPAALPAEKGPRYSLDRKLDGSPSRSGCGGEERKSLPFPFRESKLGLPACCLVTTLTELFWPPDGLTQSFTHSLRHCNEYFMTELKCQIQF
jgi:hypothetical protein